MAQERPVQVFLWLFQSNHSQRCHDLWVKKCKMLYPTASLLISLSLKFLYKTCNTKYKNLSKASLFLYSDGTVSVGIQRTQRKTTWWPQTIWHPSTGDQTEATLVKGKSINHWAVWASRQTHLVMSWRDTLEAQMWLQLNDWDLFGKHTCKT